MPKHLLWWGGVLMSLGGVVFCMGTTARLAGQFNNVHYTGVQSVSRRHMPRGHIGMHCCLCRREEVLRAAPSIT